jgi:hypothetical protein
VETRPDETAVTSRAEVTRRTILTFSFMRCFSPCSLTSGICPVERLIKFDNTFGS